MKKLCIALLLSLLSLQAFAQTVIDHKPIRLQVPGQTIAMDFSLVIDQEKNIALGLITDKADPNKGIQFLGEPDKSAFYGAQLTYVNGEPVLNKENLLAIGLNQEQREKLFRQAEDLISAMQSIAYLKLLHKEKKNFLGILLLDSKTLVLVTKD